MSKEILRRILSHVNLALKSDLDDKTLSLNKICDDYAMLIAKSKQDKELAEKYKNIIIACINHSHLIMQNTNGCRYVNVPHKEIKDSEECEISLKCDLYNNVIVEVVKGD